MSKIYKLHTANIYLNGSNYAHVASEITLPEVKFKMATHAPTALQFSFEVPLGVEPMEVSFKGDFDPGFMAAAADKAFIHSVQIYSDLVEMDDARGRVSEKQVVAYLRAMFKGTKPGAFKNGEPVEVEYTASVLAYRLEVEGVPIYDLAAASNKHEVLGANLNARSDEVIAR